MNEYLKYKKIAHMLTEAVEVIVSKTWGVFSSHKKDLPLYRSGSGSSMISMFTPLYVLYMKKRF